MSKKAALLWLDLEMTGLDPSKHRVVEAAAIITDWEFNELDSFETAIFQPESVLAEMDPWCVENLGGNGVLEKIPLSNVSENDVQQSLLELIDKHFGPTNTKVLLAGSSIHQDRRFIRRYFPDLNSRLHYRMLDVSAWRVVFEGKYKKNVRLPKAHVALDDIRRSIHMLKEYLKHVQL